MIQNLFDKYMMYHEKNNQHMVRVRKNYLFLLSAKLYRYSYGPKYPLKMETSN